MRLSASRFIGLVGVVVVVGALVPGCTSDDEAFRVATPAAGTTLDRCHVLVRTTPPVPGGLFGAGGMGLDIKEHVNWRVDGGAETEVKPMSDKRPDHANFVFGATTLAGSHK